MEITIWPFLVFIGGLIVGAIQKTLYKKWGWPTDRIPYINGALGGIATQWIVPGNIHWSIGVVLAGGSGVLQQFYKAATDAWSARNKGRLPG